ncbi:MAG: hypothetical protein GXO07_04365 [Crenarchaeota archaeon]|nr:hypothetical protein [Thermoproteota archaeon]
MPSVSNLIPLGYAMVRGPCGGAALRKILSSTCYLIKARSSKIGEFVVCNGKVLRGSWDGLEGEDAWNALINFVEKGEEVVHLTFYPSPEGAELEGEFEVMLVTEGETSSEYFSGVGAVALGKQVLAILHRLTALGLDVEDLELEVSGSKLLLKVVSPSKGKKIDLEKIKKIVLEYVEPLGIKEVEVILA